MKRITALLVLLPLLLSPLRARASDAPQAEAQTLEELVTQFRADYGLNEQNFAVSFYDTVTGEHYAFNDEHFMPAASTYKLPLNLYYYQLQNEGVYTGDELFGGWTLSQAHYERIVNSNNDVSNILIYSVGGDFWSYKRAMLEFFTMTDDEIDASYYADNNYCTRMMLDTLRWLWDRSDDYPEFLKLLLQANPTDGYFRRGVTDCDVAHKYGSFEGAENDVGIIYAEHPFLLAVYTQSVGLPAWVDLSELGQYSVGENVCAQAASLFRTYVAGLAAQEQAEALARREAAEALAREEEAAEAGASGTSDERVWERRAYTAETDLPRAQELTTQEDAEEPEASAEAPAQGAFEWWMLAIVLAIFLPGALLVSSGARRAYRLHESQDDGEDEKKG